MCRTDSFLDQRPKVSLSSHSAPQPLLEASVVTTFLLWAMSKITPCFSQRRSLQGVRVDTQTRVTFMRWRPSRQAVDRNTLLQPELHQPELDTSHMKQTQLYRCHKARHFLESFEQTGGTFLEGSRLVQNRRGSLR